MYSHQFIVVLPAVYEKTDARWVQYQLAENHRLCAQYSIRVGCWPKETCNQIHLIGIIFLWSELAQRQIC